MGTAERREREKSLRRQEIITAAEKIIFTKGLQQATMDDVAVAAELSKGTLYLYFKSKEELYFAIIHKSLDILKNLFTEAVTSAKTGLEKIKAIGEAYYRFYKEYPDYFNALLYYESKDISVADEEFSLSDSFRKTDEHLGIVIDAIKFGIKDGTIRHDIDPVKTAILLWGESTGIFQIISTKEKLLTEFLSTRPEELIKYYFDLTRLSLQANNTI